MILCSGEIPGLFPKDELEQLMEEVRVIAKKQDRYFADTPENLYKFFIARVKSRLHVVLCFSPVSTFVTSSSFSQPIHCPSVLAFVCAGWREIPCSLS